MAEEDNSNPPPIFKVWEAYEKIAMHFNDLLIKLRTQALAGVAALATIVTLFATRGAQNDPFMWELAAAVFAALCLVWIAVWILDALYYHRLLVGAVAALKFLEKESQTKSVVTSVNMSTLIEKAVGNNLDERLPFCQRLSLMKGVWSFYAIVLLVLLTGLTYSLYRIFSGTA